MLILGVVLASAQAAAAAPPVRPPAKAPSDSFAGQCLAVVVSSPQAPKRRVSFSATKILDLQFGALLRRRISGEHVLNLKVYTPKGHLYQQLDVPFRGGVASSGRRRLRDLGGITTHASGRGVSPAPARAGARGRASTDGTARVPCFGAVARRGHVHHGQLSVRQVEGRALHRRQPEGLRGGDGVLDKAVVARTWVRGPASGTLGRTCEHPSREA